MRGPIIVTFAALMPSMPFAQTPHDEFVIETETVVNRVAFSADSQTVAGVGQLGVGFWDVTSGELRQTVVWERENRFDIAVSSPVDRVAAVTADTTLSLWNLADGDLPEQLETTTPGARASSQFSPDGSFLAHANHEARELRVWEIPSGRLRFVTAQTGIGPTSTLAFSPDGTVLAGANGDTDLYVWSVQDGKLLRVIDELQLTTFALKFSPDGRYLVSGGVDRNIHLWDTGTWKRALQFEQQAEAIRSLDLSPDGTVLVTGGQDTTDNDNPAQLILWGFPSGEELTRVRLPRAVTSVAFSPDGLLLAVASGEERIRLWHLSELLE